MLFNSYQFLFFFPIVTILYFILPHRLRWLHLLISSCVFYMAFIPAYILILLFTIVIDYIAGIMIEEATGARRKRFLILSIAANVGVLSVFKYYNFFIENINTILSQLNITTHPLPFLGIILPLGLSFHTFQAMSYTIEVYRGKQKAEKHFGIYALYVMFYPQLVAGPIERPQNLLHQFKEEHKLDTGRITSGLRLMMWGLFKKVVIADQLGIVVKMVFSNAHIYSGSSILIAILFFSYQIFCDFSGYSDIAIGSARIMGFDLMRNFNAPYLAASISDFWRRWHISLSTWFRDYLYIPLGGNRVSMPRWYLNIILVFLISGLWHGANWTFVIWGGLHGFYMILESLTNNASKKLGIRPNSNPIILLLKIGITFTLVTTAWIFFRANKVQDAFYIVSILPKAIIGLTHGIHLDYLGVTKSQLMFSILLIGSLELFHYLKNKIDITRLFEKQSPLFRWMIYYACIVMIFYESQGNNSQFIYFQF